MVGIRGISVLATFAVMAVGMTALASYASAAPYLYSQRHDPYDENVDIGEDPLYSRNAQDFVMGGSCYLPPAYSFSSPTENCDVMSLVLTAGKQKQAVDVSLGFYGSVTEDWTCNLTGRVSWVASIRIEKTGQVATDSGAFRVPKCDLKWRSRKANSGTASSVAAQGWGTEFVSRSRCSGGPRKFNCEVVHNNTYRICQARFQVRPQQRVVFGVTKKRWKTGKINESCQSF